MRIGAYFYPWYNARHWTSAAVIDRPSLGLYCSENDELIGYQLALIRAAGIDFLIIQASPRGDWLASLMRETTQKIVARCARFGLRVSFLLDGVDQPANKTYLTRIDQFDDFASILDSVHAMLPSRDVLETGPDGRPLMMAFSPSARDAVRLQETYPEYYWRFPVYHGKRWSRRLRVVDRKALSASRSPWMHIALRRRFRDILEPIGFIPFWTEFREHRVFGEFAAINPGYDDRALERGNAGVPVVSRRDGAEFTEQLADAVRRRAKYALIYSWNEYFERTHIEPTSAEGLRYVNALRAFRGLEAIDAFEPSAALRDLCAAPARPSPFARRIEVTRLQLIDGKRLAINVVIENAGDVDWPHEDNIRLGYCAYDASGAQIGTGRFLKTRPLKAGERLVLEGAAPVGEDWSASAARFYVDLVAERRFWFWQRQAVPLQDPHLFFPVDRIERVEAAS